LWLHGKELYSAKFSFERCSELLPRCSNLREFEIGWLDWTELPKELALIPTLRSVVSLNAPIRHFPEFLALCPKLRRLAIRGGDVEFVPRTILEFKTLKDLDLGNNPLADFPLELRSRLNLRRLELHDTPISRPERTMP
jgi:Leucine-rich repeat (LRR) protein